MIKRIAALLLAFILILSLAACTKKTPLNPDPQPQQDVTGQKNDEPVTNPITTVTPSEPVEPEEPEKSPLELELENLADRARAQIKPVDNGMLAPAKDENGNWGYINCFGEWVISPKYIAASPFKNGYAAALASDQAYRIINADGDVCYDKIRRLEINSAAHFTEGYMNVQLASGHEQTKLYLSIDGKTMITAESLPVTSGVSYGNKTYFAQASPFVKEVAVVMRRTNKSVIEGNKNNRNLVASRGYYQSAYVINTWGEIIATLPAGYDIDEYSLDAKGNIIVRDMTTEDGLYYLCGIDGAIISKGYRRIEHCEGEMYLVNNIENGFWGYIDKDGTERIPCMYSKAMPFSQERACVCLNELWGVIDENGNYVVSSQWDDFVANAYSNIEVNVHMAAYVSDVAVARSGDYWAIIDREGNIVDAVYRPDSDVSPYKCIGNGFIVYEEDGLYGLLSLDGDIVVAPSFKDIGLFNN